MHYLSSRQGIEPLTLALAGGFLTTGPPRKSLRSVFMRQILVCSGRFSVSPGGFSTLLQTHPSTLGCAFFQWFPHVWFWLSDPSIKSLFGLYIQIPFCNHLEKTWLKKKINSIASIPHEMLLDKNMYSSWLCRMLFLKRGIPLINKLCSFFVPLSVSLLRNLFPELSSAVYSFAVRNSYP